MDIKNMSTIINNLPVEKRMLAIIIIIVAIIIIIALIQNICLIIPREALPYTNEDNKIGHYGPAGALYFMIKVIILMDGVILKQHQKKLKL
jgi:hypothetical protein